MNLKPVTTASTKQEEIDLLKKIRSLAPEGTYLSSLFTDAAIEWVSGRIEDDLPADLYDQYISANGETMKTEAKLNALTIAAERDTIRFRHSIDTLNDEVARLKQAEAEAEERASMHWRKYSGALNEAALLESEVERLKNELVALKAKLYDLTAK